MSLLSRLFRSSTSVPPGAVDDKHPQPAEGQSDRLRDIRMDRREHLYGVVRESLLHAGVPSAHFKFKVLALDDQGQQFLVMVDVASPWGGEAAWCTRLETQIIHCAQTDHGLVITSVYWRHNADLAVHATSTPAVLVERPAEWTPPPGAGGLAASSHFEPLQADEVAAFQQALAAASRAPSVSGKVHQGK